MNQHSRRHQQREEFLAGLLAKAALELADLTEATIEHLHEYARFMLTSADAPSASWNSPVIALCQAVESQVATTLADVPGLSEVARDIPLGRKAHILDRVSDDQAKAVGLQVDTLKTLSNQLKKLAKVRSKAGAAHGGMTPRHATKEDAQQALELAIICDTAVLPCLVRLRKNLAQHEGRDG